MWVPCSDCWPRLQGCSAGGSLHSALLGTGQKWLGDHSEEISVFQCNLAAAPCGSYTWASLSCCSSSHNTITARQALGGQHQPCSLSRRALVNIMRSRVLS